MKTFTKKEFRQLLDNNEIDIRPNDVCFYNGKQYLITVDDKLNNVYLNELKK